jgi:hypothetical protein
MPSSLLLSSALLSGVAYAYTQVNVPSPFMYKNVDPIVFPGSYSESHLHSFYGSDGVTASTTKSSELQSGCTTAENPNDLSVYWTPTLLYTTDGGSTYEPVPVMRFSAYYNLGETPAEGPIPQDLRMVAGVATATTEGAMDANAKSEWFCEGGPDSGLDANGFPMSTCSTHLQQLLYFPQCVNAETLETAYKDASLGTTNRCPTGMTTMPQLRFSIRYDLRKVLPDGWSGEFPGKLACGNAWCSHGDFINGWTEEAAENMVATSQSKREYSSVNGALGNDGDTMNCTPADAEPDKGTSDYAESVKLMGKRDLSAWGWSSRSRMARS